MRHLATICLVLAVCYSGQTESGSQACRKGIGAWSLGNRGYFVVCTVDANGVLTGVLYRCPDGTLFDDSDKQCTPALAVICKKPGRIPDLANCKNFYDCQGQSPTYSPILKACPPKSYFSKTNLACVPGICF